MARYIDADALEQDLSRQYKEVFCSAKKKVKPEDFYIEREAAYYARMVEVEQESFFEYLKSWPTADVAEVKWIPVTERLPKVRRDYLCICVFGESKMQFCDVLMFHPEQNAENGYVTGPHFSNEGVGGMRVTHWMPLPQPPSGAKMDGKEDA